MQQLSEQEIIRRESLQELYKLGINPYPAEDFDVNTTTINITKNFNATPDDFQNIRIAGRIMSRRIMGAVVFMEIKDSTGKIQIYIKRDVLCPGDDKTFYNEVIKKHLDIGDIIGVTGYVFITKMGEITIHVNFLKLLCKALRPLPVVKEKNGIIYDAFSSAEQRYRMRYVDLIVNPHIKEVFIARTKLINSMRNFFNERNYLEVETPVLQTVHGGASARPFNTFHNTLDMPLYLRIANELYLKRLITGGFDGVYEFSRNFRNEGMDRLHNPEFTVLEIYVAYKDYNWMMNFTEELLEKVAVEINNSTNVLYKDINIDYKRPFARVTMIDAIKTYTGIDISDMEENDLYKACKNLNIEVEPSMGKGKLIDKIFNDKCEPNYIKPTFIIDHPVEMSPLCKKHRDNPKLTERFELIINGKEIANAYTELNDPIDQAERFKEQLRLSEKGDEEAMHIDYDFLRALEYGMPPCAGLGIGIDRLTMLMTNQPSIQDVLLFPQMRPEK